MGETFGRLWRRMMVLLRWRRHQAELREKVGQRAGLHAAALEAEGRTPDEARAAADRALGNATMMREESHRVWIAGVIEDLRQAVAHALRGWDVEEPERVVAIFATSVTTPGNRRGSGFSLDQLEIFRTQASMLDGVFTYERIRPDGTVTIALAAGARTVTS